MFVFVFLSFSLFNITLFTMMRRWVCAVFHLRIANRMVKDSYCRGGIVHIRVGCSRALFVRRESPKALWRFRVSTSNSQVAVHGRILTRLFVISIILTLNKIFEYVKMTIFSRPSGSPNPKAL